jgi:recombination protein RecA
MSVKDDLANVIADNLNKKFKDNKVAYFLDGSDDTPTDIKDGLESSGKSLLASHILAETQKQGGIAVYMDTETSVSREFLQAIGVDVSKLLYLHFECVEDIFEAIEDIITKVRESDKDRLVTILVDSLAATSTKVEIEADFEKDGYATTKAIVISKALRKITQMIGRQKVALVFTNQLRQKLGVMFGDPWTTSGGKALPFHASTRVRLKNMGQIKDSKKKNILGMKCRAQIIKNRLGPPLRHADYDMYFDSGIDNYGGWLNVMKEHKLVKSGGAWYTLEYRKKEYKFQSKDFKELMETNDGLRNHLYKQICEKCILEYQKGNVGIDDVEYTGEVIGDE